MSAAGSPPQHPPSQNTPPPFWLRWHWLHLILKRWWGLLAFLGLALLGNILIVPLNKGLDHWWEGVQDQVPALLNWISSYPLQALLVIGLVFFLTGVAFIAHLILDHQERQYQEEHQRALVQQIVAQQSSKDTSTTTTSDSTVPRTIPTGATIALNPQAKHQVIGSYAQQHVTYNRNIYQRPESPEQSLKTKESFHQALPKAPPPIWHVPYKRNQSFIGREQILQQLHKELVTNKIAVLSQKISDLGGMGKTQTAVVYADRFQEEYQAVLWVRAETQQLLVDDYVSIAHLLGLPEWEASDQAQAITAVKHWLETHSGWLLIMDDVENWASLQGFLPSPGHGSLLLIARAPIAEIKSKPVILEPLSSAEGADFLLRRVGLLAQGTTRSAASTQQEIQAQNLSDALVGFPLALEHAGAYIKETHRSFASYHKNYRTKRNEPERRRSKLLVGYTKVVASTWALAFEHIKQDTTALELLRACTFLYPEAIPEALFHDGALALSAPLRQAISDPVEWHDTVTLLSKLSLLEHDPQAKILRLHRVTQMVLKEDMPLPAQRIWARQTIKFVNQAFPKVETATWERCQRYLPHALMCASLIKQRKSNSREAFYLLDKAGQYCYERAQHNLAQPLMTQALDIHNQLSVKTDTDPVPLLSNLATIYENQGKIDEALPLLQQARGIQEQQLGPEHPNLAPTLIRLAKIYQNQKKVDEALPFLQRALAIQERQLGPEHNDLASIWLDLATIYQTQGKFEQALPLLQRTVAIREQQLGKAHPDLIPILSNLAKVYDARGQDEEALTLFERARTLQEQQLGKAHPDLIPILSNLAVIYHARGQEDQELPLLRQMLQIQVQQLGPDHSNLALPFFNLGERYHSLMRYEEALPLLQRALIIREHQLGKEHLDLVPFLLKLADTYRVVGPHEEALSLLQRVLKIQKEQLGANHLELVPVLDDLAAFYQEQEQYQEAEACLQQALTIREQQLGKEHLDVALSLKNLGILHRLQGQYEEAFLCLQQALEIKQKQLGPDHQSVAASLDDLAVLHNAWAGTLRAQAQKIRSQDQLPS